MPLLGLTLAGAEPGPLVEKLGAIRAALPSLNPATLALSLGCVAALAGLKRWRPHWPRMLIVVALAAAAAALMRLPVATIESAFGGIPQGFPRPALPRAGMAEVIAVLPSALELHAARGDRVAAVGGGGGRDDRAAAPLEHGAGGAGGGEHRLRALRRLLRDRDDRADGDQRAGGGAGAGGGDGAFGVPARLRAGGGAARGVRAAGGAGGGAGGGRLGHGGEAGDPGAAPGVPGRRGGASRHLRADDLPRPQHGDRGRLRAGGDALHQPHVDTRSRSRRRRASPTRGWRGPIPRRWSIG